MNKHDSVDFPKARGWDQQTAETRRRLMAKGKWSEEREARYQSIYEKEPNPFDQ